MQRCFAVRAVKMYTERAAPGWTISSALPPRLRDHRREEGENVRARG